MEKYKKLITGLIITLMFLILVLVNFANNKFFSLVRFDLTQNKTFSLSEGSKKIIDKVDEPISFKLYFSKKLAKDNPYFLNFALRVEEFIKQYKKYAKNKIVLQIIELESFTEEEDQAVHYGLQGVPVNNEGAELYFGLVASNSISGREVIPFFQPSRENYLEYDISRIIAKLAVLTANKLAVLSSLPMQGEQGFQFIPTKARPWIAWQQLTQQFEPQILDEEKLAKNLSIPEDIGVLLLVNTGELLSLTTAQAIDNFVLRGGRVLLLVSAASEVKNSLTPIANNENQEDTGDNNKIHINKLLTAWGVKYNENQVVASRELAKQVRYNYEGTEVTGLYPLWIDVNDNYFAKNDILTNNLSKITFPAAGVISASEQSSSKFLPLISLYKDAMLVNKEDLAKYKANPMILLKEYNPQQTPVTIAARVTGKVKSAFQNIAVDTANIVVVANTDFLHDHFWVATQNFLGNPIVMPTSGNLNFVLNTLDNLAGSEDLISIRAKDTYARGFDKIRQIELQSQNKFQQAEESLLKKLEEAKAKLANIEQKSLSAVHKIEEENFRKNLIETRKQLREVRRSLKEDIQTIENKIKFFGIIFMPLIIVMLSLLYWVFNYKKLR